MPRSSLVLGAGLVVAAVLAMLVIGGQAPATVTPSETPSSSASSSAHASLRPSGDVGAASPGSVLAPTPAPPAETPAGTPAPSGDPTTAGQPALPVRAAFYYPWFPEAWVQQGFDPYTRYSPTAGRYDGGLPSVVAGHVAAMEYGGIDVGIASWWGIGSRTDGRMRTLLDAVSASPLRWTIYHEGEGQGDPALEDLAVDLRYVRDRYAGDPGFFRIGGRFVVFVYADRDDACPMVERWQRANAEIGAYLVLKIFPGYRDCSAQPDAWHQYAPANATDAQSGFSFAISPGFEKPGEPPRLGRDLDRWRRDVAAMVASAAPFQLVTTFNEWGEGTSVESAAEWATPSGFGAYLDVLHTVGSTAQAAPPAAPVPVSSPGAGAVVMAAGDIACDPTQDGFNGGQGVGSRCVQLATSRLLTGADLVLALGDNQYEEGSIDKFRASYDLSWGAAKAITRPAVGNHEYLTPGAAGYFDYFGAQAGPRDSGWYAFDVGRWRLYALNSNCGQIGGCDPGDRQYEWLANDLAAHPRTCSLAFMHHPRWSSGKYQINGDLAAIVGLLDAAGVDLMLAGHAHNYERYAPQSTDGVADVDGIRAFVVGTGGRNLTDADVRVLPNSVVRNDTAYGVLRLTLDAGSYGWSFLPIAGSELSDSGAAACR